MLVGRGSSSPGTRHICLDEKCGNGAESPSVRPGGESPSVRPGGAQPAQHPALLPATAAVPVGETPGWEKPSCSSVGALLRSAGGGQDHLAPTSVSKQGDSAHLSHPCTGPCSCHTSSKWVNRCHGIKEQWELEGTLKTISF